MVNCILTTYVKERATKEDIYIDEWNYHTTKMKTLTQNFAEQ